MARLDPQHYQTFQIKAMPGALRPATCEETECQAYARGWRMVLDLNTELGQKQAYYIKYQSGRSFTHENLGEGMVELTFRSGQPCFEQHRVRSHQGMPERYIVRGGDARGNPLRVATRVHTRPEHWVEEFAENQQKIADVIEKG